MILDFCNFLESPICTNILPNNYKFIITKELPLNFIKKYYKANMYSNILDYTQEHIDWYYKDCEDFSVVTIERNAEIIGCISGKVLDILINQELTKVYVINFLCLEFNHRKKKFIDYLILKIAEIARSRKIFSGLYISNDKHNNSLKKVKYYHYYPSYSTFIGNNINNIEFNIKHNENVSKELLNKLNEKYSKYKISYHFNNDKLFSNESIIDTFTLYDKYTNKLAGFVSYYNLNLKTYNNIIIKQAYILYYWHDNDLITLEDLFRNTFRLLNVDTIITCNIMDFACKKLRDDLQIDNEGSETYYYIYGNEIDIKLDNNNDIGIFIP